MTYGIKVSGDLNYFNHLRQGRYVSPDVCPSFVSLSAGQLGKFWTNTDTFLE